MQCVTVQDMAYNRLLTQIQKYFKKDTLAKKSCYSILFYLFQEKTMNNV